MNIVFRTETYSFLPIGLFEIEATTEVNKVAINAIQGQYGYFAKVDNKCQSIAAMKKNGYMLMEYCEAIAANGAHILVYTKPVFQKTSIAFN